MHAGGCDAYEYVTRLDLASINEFRLLHHTCGISGDVIFPAFVHTRHLGRLSAHEGATGLAAAFSHACHNCLHLLRDIVAHCHVIQEYQRLRTLGEHIVHAHCNCIDTHGIVLVHSEGNLEFGAHTVGAAHQHRLFDSEL